MDLKETEGVLQLEWAAISAAPLSFIAAVIVFCGLTWLAAKFVYQRQIVTLKEQGSTKDERLALMRDKFEAAEKARQDTETKLNEIPKALERDATERHEEVSSDVATAVSATVISMQELREKQADLDVTISDVLTIDDLIAAHAAADSVLSADDLKRIGMKDKDKD